MFSLRRSAALDFENLEQRTDYAFGLPRRSQSPGISAMVRARNEAGKIEHCLRSILPVFDEIQVIDNGSTDETSEIVNRIRSRYDPDGKIQLHSYPFRLARFGPEHADTPANSLHSAVYFTNWSLSRCTRAWVCKWDADMVLLRCRRKEFKKLLSGLRPGWPVAWSLAGLTVYRAPTGTFYESPDEVNREVEIFPLTSHCRFHKAPHWEQLVRPRWFRTRHFPGACFLEVKSLEEDEFDHWSTTEFPSVRKQREWRTFNRLREGNTRGLRDAGASLLDDQLDPG